MCIRSVFFVSLAIGILSFPAASHAGVEDLGQRLKSCKAINTLMTRISCYDELVEEYDMDTLEKRPVTPGSHGKWAVQTEISQIDDSTNVFASLGANEFLVGGVSSTKYARPSLILRCKERQMDGYIVWDFNMGESKVAVTTRFDKNQAVNDWWTASSDRTALFIPDVQQFARVLRRSENLLIQAVPRSRGPVSVTFDLRGASDALMPLYATCGVPAPAGQ